MYSVVSITVWAQSMTFWSIFILRKEKVLRQRNTLIEIFHKELSVTMQSSELLAH